MQKKFEYWGIIVELVLLLVQLALFAAVVFAGLEEKVRLVVFALAIVVALINLCFVFNTK